MARFDGRVAFVSGGARGMGAAFAKQFVEEGARVVVADILEAEGAALASELGDAALFVRLDVTDPAAWERAIAETVAAFGGLNILVNNAGLADLAPIEQFTVEQWDKTIAVNLSSAFYGIKAAIEPLKASGNGSIINISSTSGMNGNVERPAYNASKFGLRGLTKNAALDLGRYNIRVNSVHPGLIRTPMTEGDDMSQRHVALGRAAEPVEVARLVAFLASDDASFSTGSEFIVDGGELSGVVDNGS